MEYEIIRRKETGYSVSVAASKVTSFRKNFNETTTVRAYENGCIGIAGAVGKANLSALKKEAAESLKKGIAYPCNLSGGVRHDPAPKEILPESGIVPAFRALLEELSKKAPGYLFGNKINLSYETVSYENTAGASYTSHDASLEYALTIKDKKSANIMDMVYGKRAFSYNKDAVVSEVLEMIAAYENPVPMPAEKLPVVTDAGAVAPLLSHFVAEMYCSGASLLSGKMGQKVFGDRVSVLVDRNPPYTGRFFDAEGVVNPEGKFYLVKDGVFCGALATKRSAQLFSLPVSGTAGSTYDGVPGATFTGLRFENTAEGYAAAGDAIFVVYASGGDMTTTGDLGIPVQMAFLLKDGKFVGRLPELMLSGNVFDILGKDFVDVIALADGDQRLVANFGVQKA